jgi:hypothetical protein
MHTAYFRIGVVMKIILLLCLFTSVSSFAVVLEDLKLVTDSAELENAIGSEQIADIKEQIGGCSRVRDAFCLVFKMKNNVEYRVVANSRTKIVNVTKIQQQNDE